MDVEKACGIIHGLAGASASRIVAEWRVIPQNRCGGHV